MGAPVRAPGRCQRAAVFGRALLHRHRPHRGCAPDAAGDARPGRFHLLQGRSRRPADGRLRAPGQAVEGGPDSVDLPVRAARRGLGAVRAADDQRHAPHAVPGDGAHQDAAQRPGELHARWQFHPRRGARAAQLLRRRGLQLGRHRQLGRRRQADGRMDRRRRGAQRPVGRGHSPLCRLHRQPQGAGPAHRRNAGPALRDALAAAGTGIGAAAAHLAAVRPAQGQGRGVRQQERLGTRQLLSPQRRHTAPALRPGPTGLAGLDDRRTARHARSRGAVRPEFVFQAAAAGARRAGGAAAPVRERHSHAGGQDGLHRAAERTRRLRKRPDHHPHRAEHLPDRHRLGADHARLRLDLAPHRAARTRACSATSARCSACCR